MNIAEQQNPYRDPDFGQICSTLMRLHPRIVLDEILAKSDNDHLIGRFFGDWRRNDEDPNRRKSRSIPRCCSIGFGRRQTNAPSNLHSHPIFDQAGRWLWSPIALELLAISPDPVAVLRTYEHRFFSGGGSGPLSLRFVRRRPLVAALVNHENAAVQAWAMEAAERIEVNIARWDERDAADDSRFE